MEIFKIKVQEILVRIVDIEATNITDALLKVDEKYKKSEIVLNHDDFTKVNFIDTSSPSKNDEKDKLISEIIDYLYTDEEKHFEELDEPENHIFLKLKQLKTLID